MIMSIGGSTRAAPISSSLYLEGIRRPDRFRAVAEKAAEAGKPMIVAKVGRSAAGRRAAASHTGALAQAGDIDDAIFRHHGIIRGEDLDHMLDVAAAFSFCRLPRGNRVAVITGSGGSAVWMADILSAHGLELPVLEDDIQKRVLALLPSYASAQNPVDGTAQAIHEVGYARLVEIVREFEADRHDPADRLARQRGDRRQARRRARRDHRARPSSRSCCRPTRPRRRERWRGSPRPASPATPRCRAAPARSARWSTTPRSRRGGASRRRPRRPRRECATKSAARWPLPARC